MAKLGFVDTEGNVFHINQNPNNNTSGKKKKKKEETPAMVQVAKTVKPTVGQTAKHLGKGFLIGLEGGLVQSPNAELQEMELAAKKGKKIDTAGKAAKQVLNTLSTISNATNPLNAGNLINYAKNNADNAKNMTKVTKEDLKGLADVAGKGAATFTTLSNLKNPLNAKASVDNIRALAQSIDRNKTNKALGIANSAVSNTADMLGLTGHNLADATYSLVGAVDKNADKRIRKAIDTINEPIYNQQEKFAKESENYGKFTNQVAEGLQSIGNMIPSVIGSAITKNPDIGLAIMANNVKGQVTEDTRNKIASAAGATAMEEALQQGKTQEEAIQIGNKATEEAMNSIETLERSRQRGNTSALAEWGTESLSGLGLSKVFGKGVTDDVAKNIIDSYIKNPTANFLATKAAAPVSEIGEEVLSNALNKAIDRGTIDPNAKFTKEDITSTIIPTLVSTVGLGGLTGDYSRRAYQQNALQLQQAQNQMNPVQKVQSLNEVQREALIEVTNKRKQGIPLDQNDYAVIGAINNTVNDMVDAQRTQNFEDNLQLQNTINPTTLQESANQYGYKGDAEQLANVQLMLDNRGIQSRFDASMFNDNDTNALWMVDENGNRQVVFNPNANENDIMEEVAVHELAHDIMASENSNIALKPEEVLNFVQTLEGYEQARLDLEDTYSQVYDKNSPEFKSLIDEEVVADFLGKRLGNQEYVTQLTNSNPNFARKIYNWVVDKLNSIVNSGGNVRSERLYWQNIKNNFEKAYNMEYQNNKANVKYKKELDNSSFSVVENYINEKGFELKNNGNLIVNNLTNKQINDLVKLYKTTGYDDVSSEYLKERLQQGNMPIMREVADRFIEKELGYKPKYDTTKIFEDSDGNKLTKEQVEFFKDSDVRDIRGRLIPVYHRTNSDFTVFDSKAGKQHGNKYGKGFYFSITPENYGNNTITAYLNAKEGEYKYIPSKGYYVVQEPNQIKNVDNKNPTSSPDIRYSISKKTGKLQDSNGKDVKLDTSTTGTTGTLMAIHNLNESKLKGILELGGFPVPSIAVTNPNIVNHKQFGDISVLFDKSTIDPAIEANEVYDRDVWSPTFPQVDYELNDKGIDKVAKDLGVEDWKMRDYAEDNKREYLVERLLRDEDIINKYVEDNNVNYETAYKDAETRVDMHQSSKELRKFIVDNDLTVNKLVKNPNLRQKYFDAIKEYYDNSSFPEQVKENLYNEKIDFLNNGIENQKGAGDNFIVRELKRYQDDFDLIKSGENQVVDEYKTNQNKKEAAIKNGIEKYLDNEIDSIYGEKGIRNDKEYLTPSGQRRSFWQLHDEYNLENIVDALTSRDTKGTQDWIAGYGQIQAQMGKKFNSIADIKANENQLTSLSETNDVLEEARSAIESDMDEIAARNESDYTIISELLADFAKGDLTIDNFKDLTRNYYQTTQNVPDSLINKIIEDLNNLKNLPTDYFEAKPQRAVGLDEVQAIVIPNNMDSSFKKQLQDQGLTYYEYDPNIEGDRNRVINQFDNLKFSKQSEGWDSFLDRNVKSEGTKTRLKDLKTPRENKSVSENRKEKTITVRNNKGQELKLKQDKTNPNVYEKEVKIPKDNKSIVPKETMQKQLAKLKDGTKVSNFYSNLTENSKFITQENANKLSQEEIWRYAPQTNKETMANAEDRIGDTQKSLETAYGDFLSKGENFSPEDVGVGWILLKRFQDAGNYDAMVQVAKKMRNIATKSGQTVQMFNLQSRLTPEGMVKYAQSELMEAEQQFNKGKSQKEIDKYAKDFELTGEEVEFIKNQMEKIQDMPDGREKNIEMAKINKMLSDKLPHKRGDSIKAWMRISMLFNPKTQVRNVVGNALITPINALADVPASIADKAISRKTGTRTIGAPSLGGLATYGKGFAKGGVEAWQDYRTGLDTKDVDMSRFDITQKSPFVTDHKGAASVLNPVSKGLNKANSFLDLVMSGGDRVFYQGAFDASLRNQMQLNNVDTPTQDMIDIATQEALSRTWNDNNGYTQFVLNTRRALNKASIGGYGLGDVLIPFAKTPANLTKAIYDYSPVGLTSTLFKTKSIQNAIETGQITPQMQHNFAQNLGKGVAGTMLYAMAYALAKAGIATGSSDDDKDVANFIKNTMGIQPYSIKIGDKSFTYDWAQPVAAPIAIASDAYKNLTKKSDEDTMTRIFNTILDVSNTGINVLMQQSFLQGISEVLNSNEGVANGIMEQVIGLPARAVPTFVQQINNMFDKTQRVAFEKNQPLKTGKQNVMSKLPGQSEKLAPRVDALGKEVQRYGDSKSEITYALKNFLSPANQSNRQTSKAAEEIYKVYEATGDKTIMPMVAPYYIQNKTVGRIDLDSKDRATYQKISGKLVNDAVVELTNDSDYKNLSYDEKAEVLNGIVSYSNAKAKEHFTGFMANTYNSANKKINSGMSIADYYLEKTMKKR